MRKQEVSQEQLAELEAFEKQVADKGAYCRLQCVLLPDMRTKCLSIFLAELSRRYPDNHLVVVMDGAASHCLKELEVPEHMSLLRLPQYSPELNPQENVWGCSRRRGFITVCLTV